MKKEKKVVLPEAIEAIKQTFIHHLESHFAKDLDEATRLDVYQSFVYAARDFLIKKWLKSKKE